jgi:dihydropteroate synthase
MANDYNVRILTMHTRADLAAEIATIESYVEAVPRVLAKASQRLLRVERLGATEAMILKQELLALDGDALISPQVYLGDHTATTDALIFASLRQIRELARRLGALPLPPLQALAEQLVAVIDAAEPNERAALTIAGVRFAWGVRSYVMGILNVTPDSFSADGLADVASALAQAQRFADEGADIIDIGGESTRPGARPITITEELRRVVPVVALIARELALPISVDTYHAEVAAAALDAGAHMINDVWGLRRPEGGWNEPLAALVAARAVPLVLMHNRRASPSAGVHGGHYAAITYADLLGEVIGGLRACVAYAAAQGIPRERLIVDPGLGFGKTPAQNLTLMRRLGELRSIGLPILVGASRKSFIGLPLDLPAQARDEGTAATTALAIQAGADIVRVHNVLMNVRAARIADAITRVS